MENTFKLRLKVKKPNFSYNLKLKPDDSLCYVHSMISDQLLQNRMRFTTFQLYLGKTELIPSEKTVTEEGLVSGDLIFVNLTGYEQSMDQAKDQDSRDEDKQVQSEEKHVDRFVPLCVSESITNWTTPSSVRELLSHYPEVAASPEDQLAVVLHVLLVETGFRAVSAGLNQRSLPDNWSRNSGWKRLKYMIEINDVIVPVNIIMTQIGSKLAIHGSVQKKLFSYTIKTLGRYKDLDHLQELCISFKNEFSLPLLYATGWDVTQISYFPPELILKIALSLDVKSGLSFSATGKRFRDLLLIPKLWELYYKRDYPVTYKRRLIGDKPDWFKLYREETLAVRALRMSRDQAMVPFFPPAIPYVPFPGPPIMPEFPGAFGPPLGPGPLFNGGPNPEYVGIAGNYDDGPAPFQPRRRHDFDSLGLPNSGGRLGGGFRRMF